MDFAESSGSAGGGFNLRGHGNQHRHGNRRQGGELRRYTIYPAGRKRNARRKSAIQCGSAPKRGHNGKSGREPVCLSVKRAELKDRAAKDTADGVRLGRGKRF